MPHGLVSHGTGSTPNRPSTQFRMPNWPLQMNAKTSDIATVEVTFGRKYAIRYRPVNRTDEFSPIAISMASTVNGNTDIIFFFFKQKTAYEIVAFTERWPGRVPL